jgi:hypothetical protein
MAYGPLERGRISDLEVGYLLVRMDIGEVKVTCLEKQADGRINVHYLLDDSIGQLPDRWLSTHARFCRC